MSRENQENKKGKAIPILSKIAEKRKLEFAQSHTLLQSKSGKFTKCTTSNVANIYIEREIHLFFIL